MHYSCSLGLALIGLCTLTAALPAAAQNLTYTLSGVTFNDGAIATGYFDYDPTTQTLGSYDFTTTDGVTDTLTGGLYKPEPFADTYQVGNFLFQFTTPEYPDNYHNVIDFDVLGGISGVGVYALNPGIIVDPTQFGGSGEFAPAGVGDRVITAGNLIVTDAAPVPEASTTVSFGLLLALGLGGVVIAARKKKAAASSIQLP